jgi:hypothetical protein
MNDNKKKKDFDIEKIKELSYVKDEIFRKYDLIMKLYNIYENDIDNANGMLNETKNYLNQINKFK